MHPILTTKAKWVNIFAYHSPIFPQIGRVRFGFCCCRPAPFCPNDPKSECVRKTLKKDRGRICARDFARPIPTFCCRNIPPHPTPFKIPPPPNSPFSSSKQYPYSNWIIKAGKGSNKIQLGKLGGAEGAGAKSEQSEEIFGMGIFQKIGEISHFRSICDSI